MPRGKFRQKCCLSFDGEVDAESDGDQNSQKNNRQNDFTVLRTGDHARQDSGTSTQVVVSIT